MIYTIDMACQDKASPVLLIGIGNEFRSDDAAGILAARRIRAKNLPGLAVMEHEGAGMDLLDVWVNVNAVLVIDAVSSGTRPGTIHRIDARRQIVPEELFRYSTHSFGLAQAVELSRGLGTLPVNLVIYGIEGKAFHAGTDVSPEVEEAVGETTELVIGEICSSSTGSGEPR